MISILYLLCVCALVNAALDKREGDSCEVDGYAGRCVELKRCYFMIQLAQKKKQPEICSFKGKKPIVCCTDCDLVEDINKIVIDPQIGPLYKDGKKKSWDYCLNSYKLLPYDCKNHFAYTIVQDWDETRGCHVNRMTGVGAAGGVDASRGEFPHMALLGYGDEVSSAQWLCGGSVIHSRYILTAGHCLYSAQFGPVTFAALGILKRSDPDALWQKYSILRSVAHPEYQPPSKYHDIALLNTGERIKFTAVVLPACLPNARTPAQEWAWAAGWGALGPRRELADVLQKVVIHKYSAEKCSRLYGPHRQLRAGFNGTTQSCYGDRGGGVRDTCQGDSGGPLQVTAGCMYHIIGVTSYGRVCGQPGEAGMYSDVAHYVPWIESVVWP